MNDLPLAGVRIVDFGWIFAVPHTTSWLGALGADVIRIESPKRPDLVRFLGGTDGEYGINKSGLILAIPRRYRNREHLRYVAQQACLICGRKQSDPHHLRYLQPRALEALGRKASDEFAVPLCRSHHRAVHRAGDEQAWWKAAGIDPVKAALAANPAR